MSKRVVAFDSLYSIIAVEDEPAEEWRTAEELAASTHHHPADDGGSVRHLPEGWLPPSQTPLR